MALVNLFTAEKKTVIIAGSGPVGSFLAVLCAQMDFKVIVYEKRQDFTRNINLKIENGFFKEVHEVLIRLNVRSEFFLRLYEHLQHQRNKILIKELEERFSREAKRLGAKYIIREVKSFVELHKEHRASNPIILDCTGRNSRLRIDEFGPDDYNMVSIPLQHAMYINFKAKNTNKISSLYQVMKYVDNIKLTEVVRSNNMDEDSFSSVTLPVFINKELARVFDKEYPNISREPLNPFNSSKPVPDNIFFPISSLIGNLLIDGCIVDLNSVTVKKIEISCGYAKRRSKCNYICLGDSAIHLAFFRSLNLGLKHALEFFIKLSMLQYNAREIISSEVVIQQFKRDNPHLNPIRVIPTIARNVFLVITKIIWYGCFSYCFTNHNTERLTNPLGVSEDKIVGILYKLNRKLITWCNSLEDFEAKRDEDIKNEIYSNEAKNMLYDSVSLVIDINGKSFVKISELIRAAEGKYSLYLKDFKYLFQCFKLRREAIQFGSINVIISLLNQLPQQKVANLKEICDSDLSDEKKIKIVRNAVNKIFSQRRTKHIILNPQFKLLLTSGDSSVSSDFILTLLKNEIEQTY